MMGLNAKNASRKIPKTIPYGGYGYRIEATAVFNLMDPLGDRDIVRWKHRAGPPW